MKREKIQKINEHKHGPRPCWLCGTLNNDWRNKEVHCHHVFFGPNRRNSEKYGLIVDLCVAHHEYGPEAVHTNSEIDLMVKQHYQRLFEKIYSNEKFMEVFGRNYL